MSTQNQKGMRIRIFSSFCDSENCKSVYERLCETDKMENYGPDKEIYIVTDDSYTHAVIMNTAMPPLTIPKENVLGLAVEPPAFLPDFTREFVEYASRHIHKYCIGDARSLPAPFTSEYAYMWHITPPKHIPVKNRLMSIMVSQKTMAPGHQYRHDLVRAILGTNYNIDIYGRGCRFYSGDLRLKGEFTDDEPYENYHFHVCIENFSLPDYTSEKYTNALLWGATPIYWGAHNALFPDYTIRLSGDVTKDMGLIRDVVYNPGKYKRVIDKSVVCSRLSLLGNNPFVTI